MQLDYLVLKAIDRNDVRHWAKDVARGSLTFDKAVERVVEVLTEQTITLGDAPGRALREGLFSLDEKFGTLQPSSDKVDAIIIEGRDDFYASCALRLLSQLTPAGVYPNLDGWMRACFLETTPQASRPSGRSKFDLKHRDMVIVSQVLQLEEVGFNPTRNSATKRSASGCDVVATASHRLGRGNGMTYAAVERLWKKREPAFSAGFAAELAEVFGISA